MDLFNKFSCFHVFVQRILFGITEHSVLCGTGIDAMQILRAFFHVKHFSVSNHRKCRTTNTLQERVTRRLCVFFFFVNAFFVSVQHIDFSFYCSAIFHKPKISSRVFINTSKNILFSIICHSILILTKLFQFCFSIIIKHSFYR